MSDQAPKYTCNEGDNSITLSGESAPDCVGKLLGARCFWPRHPRTPSEHRDDRLYSIFYDHMWTPGKDERAQCLYRTASMGAYRAGVPLEHASPHGSCTCGLYAYYSYYRLRYDIPQTDRIEIFAVVSGWGDIEEHKNGFRSEYMRIEALVGPSLLNVRRRKVHKMIERFAEVYGVPVIWRPRQVHRWMDDFVGGVRLKSQK